MENFNKDLVLASLMPELTRQNLKQVFDECLNSVITKETLPGSYELFIRLRDIYDSLIKRKEEEDKPEKAKLKARKEGYDTYLKPIKEFLEKVEPILAQLNSSIKNEEKEQQAKIDEENAIKQMHIEFVNATIKSITSAEDNKTLVSIQSLIGLELTRKKYGNYQPIRVSCKSMLALIETRKNIIKENTRLGKEYVKAMSINDLPKATQIMEEIENNKRVISENALSIAEDAYKQVAEVSLDKNQVKSLSIKPLTHRWSYRIDNMQLLKKKHPELFETVPDEKALREFMDSRKESLDKEDEHFFDGLVIYYKSYFVAPSK